MRIFVLPSLILGSLLLLTSCAANRTTKTIPSKTFQYAFQAPSRILSTPGFAKQLTSGKQGSSLTIKLPNNRLSSVKLGKSYFSASGYQCRRYKIESRFEYSACKIKGRWHETSPIIISNK